jgi:hypothetical protein
MEYITMVRYLEIYMPADKGLVADIGSDSGRYSLWHSYDVILIIPITLFIRK